MSTGGSADEALVRRAQAGDRAAREILWRDHRRWVAAVILAHRPRSIDVDDLMQDVAVKLLTKLDTLRDPAAFRPWLRRIAVNACRGAARKHRPSVTIAAGEDIQAGEIGAPEDRHLAQSARVDHQDAVRRLLDHAATLPPEYREPLLLRCLHEMSYQRIGELLELPVTTIETRLARARRMLRAEMEKDALSDDLN